MTIGQGAAIGPRCCPSRDTRTNDIKKRRREAITAASYFPR
jgi:hypothetical protein